MAPHVLIAFCLALGGGLLLVTAGGGHLGRPRGLRHVLAAQRVLPAAWCGAAATVVAVAEILVGGFAIGAVLFATMVAPALVAQAAVYGLFAGYLTLLRTMRPGAPCGCLRADEPTTWLVVGRAAVLAAGAGMAAGMSTALTAAPTQWRLVAVAGGFVVAMTGWLVPLVFAPRAAYL